MTRHDYGVPDTYEIAWTSGHVERLQAHQVLLPQDGTFPLSFGGGVFGSVGTAQATGRGWAFHAEIDGKWTLLLSAAAEAIRSVRNVTRTSDFLDGAP